MDLSLVPLNDLLDEIDKRTDNFICAYETKKEKDKEVFSFYGKGSWIRAISLSNMLNNDVLNNWNGEMKTLQRINDEKDIN